MKICIYILHNIICIYIQIYMCVGLLSASPPSTECSRPKPMVDIFRYLPPQRGCEREERVRERGERVCERGEGVREERG